MRRTRVFENISDLSAFIEDPFGLHLRLRKRPRDKDVDVAAYFASTADFASHGLADAGIAVLDEDPHDVHSAFLGREPNLKFVPDPRDRPHGLLDLHREELDAAQIDEIVGTTGEATHRPHVFSTAETGRVLEDGVVTHQEA